MTDEMPRPVLRIVRGEPSEAELAALVAVLARAAGVPVPEPGAPSAWRDRAALLRRPLHPGPGAWRAVTWRL